MKREIRLTADGSTTIYLPDLDENYHSHHGAIQEAQHVFIKNGLEFALTQKGEKEELNILEIGFGTGLNALLTALNVVNLSNTIKYLGIEAFPVASELLVQMNYIDQLKSYERAHSIFSKIHQATWENYESITSNFELCKQEVKLEHFESEQKFDLVYYDAFGPRAQIEMWSIQNLEIVAKHLKSGGILVTYCAKGQFKRDLRSLGFEIEALPGPPGKREMVRATKI